MFCTAQAHAREVPGSIPLRSGHSRVAIAIKTLNAITPADVKQFLDGPRTGPATWRRKYGTLRDFFEYWRVPRKVECSSHAAASAQVHADLRSIYLLPSPNLRLLLDAVPCCQRNVACRISASTLRTLLLLLYGTGMRMGEALRLLLAMWISTNGVITIRGTKFYKSRLVPLGRDVHARLQGVSCLRREDGISTINLFSSRGCTQAPSTQSGRKAASGCCAILQVFAAATRVSHQPRLHDLRHTFAVHRLTEWYRKGADVQALLPALSTYLGHVDLHSTQCYLTMTPEFWGRPTAASSAMYTEAAMNNNVSPWSVDQALPDGIPRPGAQSGSRTHNRAIAMRSPAGRVRCQQGAEESRRACSSPTSMPICCAPSCGTSKRSGNAASPAAISVWRPSMRSPASSQNAAPNIWTGGSTPHRQVQAFRSRRLLSRKAGNRRSTGCSQSGRRNSAVGIVRYCCFCTTRERGQKRRHN